MSLDFAASTCPTRPVADVRATEAFVAALWGVPVAAISDTAPYAAVRRVLFSWSVRVMDIVVAPLNLFCPGRCASWRADAMSVHPDPRSTSIVI
jgi:hypothetical protein